MIEDKTTILTEEQKSEVLDKIGMSASEHFGSFLFYKAVAPDTLLKPEEEKALSKTILESDDPEAIKEAKETLITHNVRLVLDNAKDFYFIKGMHGTLALDDLVQAGMLGLITAADRYDYSLGFRFSTYATHWIQQAIRRVVANEGSTVRLPVHMHEFITFYNRLRTQFTLENDRDPTNEEMVNILYDVCEVEKEFEEKKGHAPNDREKESLRHSLLRKVIEVGSIYNSYLSMPSLDMMIGEDDDSTLIDFIADDSHKDASVEDTVLQKYLMEGLIEEVKKILPEREYEIISLRFGLKDGKVYTLNEVGEMMNPPITRERVRQLESKALLRLRRHPGIRKYLQTGSNDGTFFIDLGNYYEKIWTTSGNLRAGVQPYIIESLISLIVHNTTYKTGSFIYDPKTISEVSQATKRDNLDAYYDLKKLRNSCKAILNARHKPSIER